MTSGDGRREALPQRPSLAAQVATEAGIGRGDGRRRRLLTGRQDLIQQLIPTQTTQPGRPPAPAFPAVAPPSSIFQRAAFAPLAAVGAAVPRSPVAQTLALVPPVEAPGPPQVPVRPPAPAAPESARPPTIGAFPFRFQSSACETDWTWWSRVGKSSRRAGELGRWCGPR